MRNLIRCQYSLASEVDLLLNLKDEIEEGETLGLVILGSDKTHLNKCYGDKKAHCVYMSCGNISKDLRMKESSRCWVKVAEIPVVKFLEKQHQGILSQRLYHLCLDIATAGLKACSHHPEEMTDANGIKRLVRTILLAHISDYPEQQLIACVGQNFSPVSMAEFDEFDSPEMQEPRTRSVTLNRIKRVSRSPGMTVTKLARYKSLALEWGLNGVHKPYWRNWKFADPSTFLAPDALHQWHRFFYDHVITWTKTLLGSDELDGRYARLQKRIGCSHFSAGFTHFGQHTCREFREIQRSFIAVIAGHKDVDDSAMLAFRGLLEFIYYAQFDSLSSTSISKLEASLSLFHDNKKSLARLRNGPIMAGDFHIPKLELMQHVARRAKLLGSLPQYSTEQIERCHITMAKEPYRATNRKNFEEQVCRYLDRHEKIALFLLYLEQKECSDFLDEFPEMPDDASALLINGLEEEFLPQPVQNMFLFEEHHVPRNSTTAFVLTDRITYGNMKVSEVSKLYKLPRFRNALQLKFRTDLERDETTGENILPFQWVDCWDRVRMQLRRKERGDDLEVLPSRTVLAAPPSSDYPFGRCNFVLVQPPNGITTARLQSKFGVQSSSVQ